MSAVEKKSFCINEYNEYEPVIQCALKVFLRAKKQGKLNFLSDIDKIIGNLFAINDSYAGKLRKLYFPTSRNQNNEALYIECLTKCKISHFNFRLMISECRKHNICIPDETYDGMLLLSTYALPVSEILKEKSSFEIHKQLRYEVEHWIEEIDAIMGKDSDLKARIFMYLHQFRDDEFTWWLLAALSSIDEEKIKHWIDELHNLPSEKTTEEMLTPPQRINALFDFYDKFPRLNASNLKTAYNHISVFDLQCAYFHMDYLKQFTHTPLRRDDIYLTYLILATLKQWPQELILEQIASASKANLPIDFCPTDELLIDWETQTAW